MSPCVGTTDGSLASCGAFLQCQAAHTRISHPTDPGGRHLTLCTWGVQGVRRRASGLGRPAPPKQQPYTHLLCISPDAPTNPVLYWLGNMAPEGTRFLLDRAKGPLHLDLGDVLYAPNIMVDHKVAAPLCLWLLRPC